MSLPHDRPTAAELVEAVREWIERGLVERGVETNVFHARVAVNMLSVVERELALGADHAVAHQARLDQLGMDGDVELAAAIRSGALGDRADEVRALVWASVRDKLAVANPRYLERVEPSDDVGPAA